MLKKNHLLSNIEVSAFCSQIAMILRSGVSISEGVSIMILDSDTPAAKEILEQLYSYIDNGELFSQALRELGCFPEYVLNMAELGEKTGRLDTVMHSLCEHYEREAAISKNIRSSVAYPLIMVIMMVAVFFVLMVEVLPVFNQVFNQLGAEMGGFSTSLMQLGQLIMRYSVLITSVIIMLIIAFLAMKFSAKGQRILSALSEKIFKRISAKIAAERFASSMSIMLKSGLDIDQSLEMAYKLVDNRLTRTKIDECRNAMKNGAGFSEALLECRIFSGIHAHMVSIAAKTGATDTIMDKLSDVYESEIDTSITNAISIFEPTLVAVLSIIVGMVLLSVMLPLMGIMSTIG